MRYRTRSPRKGTPDQGSLTQHLLTTPVFVGTERITSLIDYSRNESARNKRSRSKSLKNRIDSGNCGKPAIHSVSES